MVTSAQPLRKRSVLKAIAINNLLFSGQKAGLSPAFLLSLAGAAGGSGGVTCSGSNLCIACPSEAQARPLSGNRLEAREHTPPAHSVSGARHFDRGAGKSQKLPLSPFHGRKCPPDSRPNFLFGQNPYLNFLSPNLRQELIDDPC
jgi:hypothetical protein